MVIEATPDAVVGFRFTSVTNWDFARLMSEIAWNTPVGVTLVTYPDDVVTVRPPIAVCFVNESISVAAFAFVSVGLTAVRKVADDGVTELTASMAVLFNVVPSVRKLAVPLAVAEVMAAPCAVVKEAAFIKSAVWVEIPVAANPADVARDVLSVKKLLDSVVETFVTAVAAFVWRSTFFRKLPVFWVMPASASAIEGVTDVTAWAVEPAFRSFTTSVKVGITPVTQVAALAREISAEFMAIDPAKEPANRAGFVRIIDAASRRRSVFLAVVTNEAGTLLPCNPGGGRCFTERSFFIIDVPPSSKPECVFRAIATQN